MRVVHIGPPLARLGGPAGYLHELYRAAAGRDARGHEVLFPPSAVSRAAHKPAAPPSPWREAARRVKRRLLGPPRRYRPPQAELRERGGRIHRMMEETAAQVVTESAASLELADRPGVLFTHDVFAAEHLLECRRPEEIDQEVWLLVHAPFPIALYLVWSWAVPEMPWEEILALPDVAAWVDRELAVWEKVDRLILPCREAGEELVRCDPRFAAPLGRAGWLLTGAAGPAPADPAASRAVLRNGWGLPADRPVGLFLGNSQPYRGLDALLAALPELPSEDDLPGVLAVAGPAPESLPAHPRLCPLGRVADVAGLLRAVDFVVNVNRFSLFDLSTIEAAEAGLPLLLHDTGGNRTFRDLGAGCGMIPDLAPASIAAGLASLLALTARERAALGRASRACYEAHLTPARLWERHLDLYDFHEKESHA
jgi:glycosyltransferase involved in cell wall biosynthesis